MSTPKIPTPPAEYADLDLVGFLYNTCYGGFHFSKAFMERVNERRVAAGRPPYKSEYEASYSTERSDPDVIATYLELGRKESSGRLASISITWVPREFLDLAHIREYDGTESVGVDFTLVKANLLETFLADWKKYPSLSVEELNHHYTSMKEKEARYAVFKKEWLYKQPWDDEKEGDADVAEE